MRTPSLSFGVTNAQYKKGDHVNVRDVAIWNEYGTDKIPPRPAFRRGLEAGVAKNRKLIDAQLRNIAQQALSGRNANMNRSLTVMLTQIGKSAKAATKQIIKTGSETPNAPATVAKKGFNHPLFETGLLLDHVEYEISK